MYVSQITLPSQFNPATYSPSYDATGASSANAITGEQQTFIANASSNYTFIIPTYGPFFAASMVVASVVGSVVTPLVLNVDYYLCLPFLGASRSIGLPIYGGILFVNPNYAGTVQLAYQTLGGPWVTGQTLNASILATVLSNPAVLALEQAANYQTPFPITNSPWDKTDGTTLSQVTAQLGVVETNIINKAKAQNYNAQIAHIANQQNPHGVTVADINLDLVANLPPAANLEARDVTNNSAYISAAQVNSMMVSGAAKATATADGVVELDLGTMPGDDSSQIKVLTAASFSSMAANSSSAIGAAMNKGQIQGFVTPFPFSYPIGWGGQIYYNQAQFLAAVQNSVNLTSLEYSSSLGCFWFPANTIVPSLVVTSS